MTNGPVIEEQLSESFRTAMERGRIALFSAPCGFGKTVVARALLEGCRVRELSADGETLDLPTDDGTWDVLLLDELQSLPESGQEPLCALLRTAVERRFVLLSRGGLPGWLAPFQFSGLLRVFIADDLALHRVGAAELLARCGVTLPDTELTAVLRDTCGHPLALELLGRCMAARREGYTPVVEQTVRRQMMAYFEDAVYRRFDLSLRRFLLELAPFEPFDLELARIATGDSRAGEHLAWLQQQTSMLLYGGGTSTGSGRLSASSCCGSWSGSTATNAAAACTTGARCITSCIRITDRRFTFTTAAAIGARCRSCCAAAPSCTPAWDTMKSCPPTTTR